MLYQAYQAHTDLVGPVRSLASRSADDRPAAIGGAGHGAVRNLAAAYELISRACADAHAARRSASTA